MKTNLLEGLCRAGLCWLALAMWSIPVNAQTSCQSCQQGCARTNQSPEQDCCLGAGLKWLLHCDYYILPPDYGWNVPTKVPVVRKGVNYYRYWPEQWYGTGGTSTGAYRQYPQVANPTDTTQMGYTYQQVPYWQPQSSRIPPSPVPSQWHVRQPHHGYNGRWHSYHTPIHSNLPAEYQGAYSMAPSYMSYGNGGCPSQPIPAATPNVLRPVPTEEMGPPPRADGLGGSPTLRSPMESGTPISPDTSAPTPKVDSPIPMPPAPEGPLPVKGDTTARRAPAGRALVSQRTRW